MNTYKNNNRRATAFQDAVEVIRSRPESFAKVHFQRNAVERDEWVAELDRFDVRFPDGWPKHGDRKTCCDYLVTYLFLNMNSPNPDHPAPPKTILRLRDVLRDTIAIQGSSSNEEPANVERETQGEGGAGKDHNKKREDTEDGMEPQKEHSEAQINPEPEEHSSSAETGTASPDNTEMTGNTVEMVDLAILPRCLRCCKDLKKACSRQQPRCDRCTKAGIDEDGCVFEPESKRNKRGLFGHRTGIVIPKPS